MYSGCKSRSVRPGRGGLGAWWVCGLLLLGACSPRPAAERAAGADADLSLHPLYRSYRFGGDAGAIDVAIQPLWVPVNIIVEPMRRDTVLRRALAA